MAPRAEDRAPRPMPRREPLQDFGREARKRSRSFPAGTSAARVSYTAFQVVARFRARSTSTRATGPTYWARSLRNAVILSSVNTPAFEPAEEAGSAGDRGSDEGVRTVARPLGF